jgi:hypothetical protein
LALRLLGPLCSLDRLDRRFFHGGYIHGELRRLGKFILQAARLDFNRQHPGGHRIPLRVRH